MRTFLPLTAEELLSGVPPTRRGYVLKTDAPEEDLKSDELLDEAAFGSLALTLDSRGVPRRIVAVSAVEDPLSWEQIECIYVDDEAAANLIEAAREAQTQEELDALVEQIGQLTPDWYDISELDDLRRIIAG